MTEPLRRAVSWCVLAPFGSLTACTQDPIYSRVPVSALDLRAALPQVETSIDGSVVRDDTGQARSIHRNTTVELPAEPPLDAVQVSLQTLYMQCATIDAAHPEHHCDLDGRTMHPQLSVQTGTSYSPRWDSIGAFTAGLLVLGGVVAGETYCFVNCGTGGKVALVAVDVVVAVAGTLALLSLLSAMNHGMNN